MSYRYSHWDGTQEIFQLHEDDIMEELSDYLMWDGDIAQALQRMMQRGLSNRFGDRLRGLQDMLQQLRSRKQQELEQHNLNSILDDIRQKLDDVIRTEREGIERRLQ